MVSTIHQGTLTAQTQACSQDRKATCQEDAEEGLELSIHMLSKVCSRIIALLMMDSIIQWVVDDQTSMVAVFALAGIGV